MVYKLIDEKHEEIGPINLAIHPLQGERVRYEGKLYRISNIINISGAIELEVKELSKPGVYNLG